RDAACSTTLWRPEDTSLIAPGTQPGWPLTLQSDSLMPRIRYNGRGRPRPGSGVLAVTLFLRSTTGLTLILTLSLLLATEAKPAEPPRTDQYGDRLPPGALARLGTARWQHWGAHFVTFLADGKTLLSIAADQSIRLWDVATGREIRRLREPQTSFLFNHGLSADQKTVALGWGTFRRTVCLLDATTGRETRRINGLVDWQATIPSPDGKILAVLRSPREGGAVELWDATTGMPLRQFLD